MIGDDVQASVLPVLAWLMTYTVHSTLLLGGAALVAWRFSDEHWWLARLWKAAMLGAIVTTSLQMATEREPLTGRWTVIPDGAAIVGDRASEAPTAARRQTPKDRDSEHSPAETSTGQVAPVVSAPGADRNPSDDTVVQASTVTPRAARQAPRSALPWVAVACWVGAAAFGLVRFILAHHRVRRLLFAGARGTTADLDQFAIEIRDRAAVRLVVSETCDVPMALPGRTIVVPERFTTELRADEQRAALAHEIAHIVRRDAEWQSLAVILERVFFFQPLHRLARRELSASAEFLCDEWAVRYTGTPLALARCLASVATWATPTAHAGIGAVAMARHDSPLVRRVQRILDEPRLATRRPSTAWLAAAVIAVGVAAPTISGDTSLEPAVVGEPPSPPAEPPRRTNISVSEPADVASARAEPRIFQPPNPGDSLQHRWDWALAEAKRRGLRNFWIAYSFETPTHAADVMVSDSEGGSFVNHGGMLTRQLPASGEGPGGSLPTGAQGHVVVTLKYSAARDTAISRAGYHSARLDFDFGGRPIFWLGVAPEADSFAHLQRLTTRVHDEKLRILFIEAASLHPTTDLVLPFLVRFLDPSNPVAIRREAAEGFDHHHDPRSVEILLRTARQDPSDEVRAEAAETIGEVQTPESVPALKELALGSPDGAVRREAAEAFSDQPADLALPALETVIASSSHEDALAEAVEALGDIGGARAAGILLDVAWKHPNERARQEAVETLASIDGDASRAALVRIVWEHPDVSIQREAVESLGDKAGADALKELERIVRDHPNEDIQAEAIETIGDVSEQGLNGTVVETARSGKNARVRREAIDALSHAAGHTSDTASLDRIEQVLEAAIFEDPDRGVRSEAIGALEELPTDRAKRVIRKVIDRHPDAQVREKAGELDLERNR